MRKLIAGLLSLVVAVAWVGMVGPSVATAAAAPQLGWSYPVQLTNTGGDFVSVSCPTSAFCVALGAKGWTYTWNGKKWATAGWSHAGSESGSISCPTVSFCAALAGNGYATTWNGHVWSEVAQLPGNKFEGYGSVSCTSSTFCVAAVGGILVTWNGHIWGSAVHVHDVQPYVVSCHTRSFCVAVGRGHHGYFSAGFNGRSWSAVSGPSPDLYLPDLSCPSQSTCFAPSDFRSYQYTAGKWSSSGTYADGNIISAVSCASASSCMAVGGGDAYPMVDRWPALQIDPIGNLTSISCPTTTFCMAVDASGRTFEYGLSAWESDGSPSVSPLYGPRKLSCPTSTFCAEIGAFSSVVYSSGAWGAPQTVDSYTLEAISCASSAFCVAVDDAGDEVTYSDGDWEAPVVIEADDHFASVSCSSASRCVAVGNGPSAVWNGTSWAILSGGGGVDVSCAGPTFCEAITADGHALTLTGSTWSAPVLADPGVGAGVGAETSAISCGSSSSCTLVDQDGYAVIYNNGSWSKRSNVGRGLATGLVAVSCAAAADCVAVGGIGAAALESNGTWTRIDVFAPNLRSQAISCPKTTDCFAIANERAFEYT